MPKLKVWIFSLLVGLMIAALILSLCLMAGALWTEFAFRLGNGG